jgi:predicted regulator of Ras-like GTPase activity (Roadblock/LC7/MglB family)
MLRKVFGSEKRSSARRIDGAELEQALAGLVQTPPRATWAALVRTNGLLVGCFPSLNDTHQDRIAAMSAALLSLGERVSKELRSGALQYALIAGEEGLNLVVILDRDYMLALGLPPNVAPDAVLAGVRTSIIPLLQLLEIVEIPL